jgi:hypothetical protein
MRFQLDPILSAFIQQNATPAGTNPGRFMFGVLSAVTDGAGAWTITPEQSFTEDEVELELTPGFGSDAGGQGISFGVSALGAGGAMAIRTYRNDTGAAVAVGFYITVNRRQKFPWD